MLLACLSTTSGWLVPLSGVVRPAVGPSASRSLRMQEAEAAQTSDAFTEDLLDALAADESLLREDLPEFKRVTSELGIRTNQLLKPKLAGARGRRVGAPLLRATGRGRLDAGAARDVLE